MMNQFELELSQVLRQAAREFRSGGLEGDFALRFERLAGEAGQPCLLAVVGRMKAGKSTFINAFLDQDLAKVGVTETTATINFFRYGQLADPALPVLCHWQNGSRPSPVSREFVDSLQGHNPQTLERASRIKYLEYRLPHPYLQRVNLVDTPGMAAVVSEHEARLRAFMAEFRPDALVYLFGEVGRDTDRQFLEEFRQVTGEGGAAALNTLGVMAKIDLQPDFPSGPLNRAASLARQFHFHLNTVIPVSAELERSLTLLNQSTQARLNLMSARLGAIPPVILDEMLEEAGWYRFENYPDCPTSPAERQELLQGLDWNIFKVIVGAGRANGWQLPALMARLEQLSGFGPLRRALQERFFERSAILRCLRTASTAFELLSEIQFGPLLQLEQAAQFQADRLNRFLGFIQHANGDNGVRRELAEFVSLYAGGSGQFGRIKAAIQTLETKLDQLNRSFKQESEDLDSLQLLEQHADFFNSSELEELRSLFGLYGRRIEHRLAVGRPSLEYVRLRQQFWAGQSYSEPDPVRQNILQRANTRYGLIQRELSEQPFRT